MHEAKDGEDEDEQASTMPTRLAKALGIVSLETKKAVEFLREDMEIVRYVQSWSTLVQSQHCVLHIIGLISSKDVCFSTTRYFNLHASSTITLPIFHCSSGPRPTPVS